MNDQDQEPVRIEIRQWSPPAAWLEWLIYGGALSLYALGLTTGIVWFNAAVTGCLLYWNYLLFGTIRRLVRQSNSMEIMRLLAEIKQREDNNTKDGTISVQHGLTEGDCDEQEEG